MKLKVPSLLIKSLVTNNIAPSEVLKASLSLLATLIRTHALINQSCKA